MNQEIKVLSMDGKNANFERNLSGFILSVLHASGSETESDVVSVQQTKDIETASEEERSRVAFLGDVRTKEFERLTATMTEQNDEAGNTETASEEERVAFFGDVRTKELERLASTLNKQVDNAENRDVQSKPSIITEENIKNLVEIEALDTEETASEEEREAFFQSIRDEERKKIVEAFEKEKIWKEEREERREKKKQERVRKMFEEFHKPAVSTLSASQEPGPSNKHYHLYPSSSNTEYNIILKASVSKLHKRVQAFAEEQKDLQRKLEQSHAIKLRADTEENKENRHISTRTSSDAEILLADRINDVKRTGSVRRFVSRIFKRSKSATAELNSKQVDPEELKLDLTLLDKKKRKNVKRKTIQIQQDHQTVNGTHLVISKTHPDQGLSHFLLH